MPTEHSTVFTEGGVRSCPQVLLCWLTIIPPCAIGSQLLSTYSMPSILQPVSPRSLMPVPSHRYPERRRGSLKLPPALEAERWLLQSSAKCPVTWAGGGYLGQSCCVGSRWRRKKDTGKVTALPTSLAEPRLRQNQPQCDS